MFWTGTQTINVFIIFPLTAGGHIVRALSGWLEGLETSVGSRQ